MKSINIILAAILASTPLSAVRIGGLGGGYQYQRAVPSIQASDPDTSASVTLNNIVSYNNSVVVLEGSIQQSTGVSAMYNGNPCSADISAVPAGPSGYYLYVFSCGVTMGGTANGVISWTGNKNAAAQATVLWQSKVISGSQGPDVLGSCNAGSTGTTQNPSVALGASGTTCTGSTATSVAAEICIGVAVNASGTISGTWQSGFTDGQHVTNGGSGTVDDGYIGLSSTQTVTANKTGASPARYAIGVACYEHS